MKEIFDLFVELDSLIVAENREREARGGLIISPAKIQVLGQVSLILNEEVVRRIPLFATQDIDVLVDGDIFVVNSFRRLLEKRYLQFDLLAREVWLPRDATFIPIYHGERLEVQILDPLSALTSKAVKAPEKNLALIREALAVYGNELEEKIRSYGVDPSKFKAPIEVKL